MLWLQHTIKYTPGSNDRAKESDYVLTAVPMYRGELCQVETQDAAARGRKRVSIPEVGSAYPSQRWLIAISGLTVSRVTWRKPGARVWQDNVG